MGRNKQCKCLNVYGTRLGGSQLGTGGALAPARALLSTGSGAGTRAAETRLGARQGAVPRQGSPGFPGEDHPCPSTSTSLGVLLQKRETARRAPPSPGKAVLCRPWAPGTRGEGKLRGAKSTGIKLKGAKSCRAGPARASLSGRFIPGMMRSFPRAPQPPPARTGAPTRC